MRPSSCTKNSVGSRGNTSRRSRFRYLEGLTHDEVAARLCWPVGTVVAGSHGRETNYALA